MGTHTTLRRRRTVTPATVLLAGLSLLAGAGLALAADARATSEDQESAFRDAVTYVKVRTELLTKLGWDGLRIDVNVHGPDVVLAGTVTKRSTQHLAEEVTLAVSGVQHVTDDVRVGGEPATETRVKRTVDQGKREVSDALLEMHVKGRLLEEIGREAMHVEVEAADGVVSLRGTVPTAEQREVAVRTAERTKGVTKVIDLIRAS